LVSSPSSVNNPIVREGVAPLRAGQGHSFFLRRLHSLTGIVPIGLFLVEHFVSNAFATKGPGAYSKQVEFLNSFPFVVGLELFGIWLPILYHALYGFYIWYRGDGNTLEYPWTGNWMYSAQRWTGAIAFFFMAWHTWHLRFTPPYILENPGIAFGKVQHELFATWALAFYVIGIVSASWHFAYGLWLFAAKWGITQGPVARRRWGYVCAAIAIGFIAVGLVTLTAFRSTPRQPYHPSMTDSDSITMR